MEVEVGVGAGVGGRWRRLDSLGGRERRGFWWVRGLLGKGS